MCPKNLFYLFAIFLIHSVPAMANDPGCESEISTWLGAYYRKVVSPVGFVGISTEVELPYFTPDPNRQFHLDHSKPNSKTLWDGPLDLPDVYMGASNVKSGEEMDTGLAWATIKDSQGRLVLAPKTSRGEVTNKAKWFYLQEKPLRLFDPEQKLIATSWKFIEILKDKAGLEFLHAFTPYYRNNEDSTPWHSFPSQYFFPGEKTQMVLYLEAGVFRLSIQSSARKFSVNWQQHGFFNQMDGFKFKRIASLDQFSSREGRRVVNEGAAVRTIPTSARLERVKWLAAQLKKPDGSLVPFSSPNCLISKPADLNINYEAVFPGNGIDPVGGETFNIDPTGKLLELGK